MSSDDWGRAQTDYLDLSPFFFCFFFPPLSFHVKLEVVGGCGFNKAGEGIQQEGFRSGVLVSKGEGHVKISHWSALAFFGPVPFL